ncbi:MAG: type I-E CRISPR-associated endoribonuclease Cas2 [Ectothiorhodospiraceae bacterium]|nr:type I-E CRISPR-associated endoribonuclease Cas2 [Ectothiorhodospiraceae bacterium]
MVVYSVECAPQRLRGVLSRYCLEIRAGLFVGRLDARMRELLWEKILDLAKEDTNAVMIWRTPTEQGYSMRQYGEDARNCVEMDGIWLIEYEGARS